MIEAEALTRRFGAFTAVSHVSFTVQTGRILALLGPNGAGKTTTVRMLAALIAPSEGTAQVAGYDVCREPGAVRASVGLVTDAPGLYEQMPVDDYLHLFGTIYGLNLAGRRRRVEELIAFFDLGPYRKQRMVGFSKGMKQKVALARALIHEPPVLFLDEPAAGLDPLAARAVRDLILSLKQSSRTIVLCTHDLDEAERLADEVAIMRQGRIVAQDAPAALRAHAAAGATVQIDLARPCPAAWTALQGAPGVQSTRHPGAVTATTGDPDRPARPRLIYQTAEPLVVNPKVIALLVAAGAEIVSVTIEAPTLEDVYASVMTVQQTEAAT
jgi:ABC-2 type transport system ATP-binding protein